MWFTLCYLYSFILKAWQLRKPNLPWGQLALELPNANVQKAAGWSRACVAWHCTDPGQVLLHTLHQEWGWRLGFARNALSPEYPLQRLASAGFVQKSFTRIWPPSRWAHNEKGGFTSYHLGDSPLEGLVTTWCLFPLAPLRMLQVEECWGLVSPALKPGNLLGLLRRQQGSLHPTPIIPYRGPVMFSEVSFVSGP